MNQIRSNIGAISIVALELIVMGLYGWTQFHTVEIMILFVAVEAILLFLGRLFVVLFHKYDKYQAREKVPLAIRHFLRLHPEIRAQVAVSTTRVLVTILITQQIVWVLLGNLMASWAALLLLLLLGLLIYLLSTLLPDYGGKVVRFDEVKTILANAKLPEVYEHFSKSVNFYDNTLEPDIQNCVKEAACALEAYISKQTGEKDFDVAIRKLSGNNVRQIPHTLTPGLSKLHDYRGGAKGVAHAAIEGSKITKLEAELVLNLTASYLVYFHELFLEAADNS